MFNILFLIALSTLVLRDLKKKPSQQVVEICTSMTNEEKQRSRRQMKKVFLCLCLYITFWGIIGFIFSFYMEQNHLWGILGMIQWGVLLLLALLIIGKPFLKRFHQDFYASTKWAKGQGLSAKDIELWK